MVNIGGLKEVHTIRTVLSGKSLARFGDGELMICSGGDAFHQKFDKSLQAELRSILSGETKCIVGVPHSEGTRSGYWKDFLKKHPVQNTGYSSFVSRFDEVPIGTFDYRKLLEKIWKGKDVALVTGSIRKDQLTGAKSVRVINAPRKNAYEKVNELESLVGKPDVAILSAGATATVLADRLSRQGIHAVDLGFIGRFL